MKVSVIVPMYNVQDYVCQCLDSFGLPDFERYGSYLS